MRYYKTIRIGQYLSKFAWFRVNRLVPKFKSGSATLCSSSRVCPIIIYDASLHRFSTAFFYNPIRQENMEMYAAAAKITSILYLLRIGKMFSGQFVEINSMPFSWLRFGKHLLNFIDRVRNKFPRHDWRLQEKSFRIYGICWSSWKRVWSGRDPGKSPMTVGFPRRF